jgi:D-arabinose 5-phosphate isomerase GutQ
MSPVDKLEAITPPESVDSSPALEQRLMTAVHVLSTEATALSHLTRLYETDPVARAGFNQSVELIRKCMDDRGKIIICGVGKSGYIAKKLVATMNSLRITSSYLHPTEALHGDLGQIGDHDVILLITFSGRTPELLTLVPHFNPSLPLLVLTSHVHPSTCPIADIRPDVILLPAPIHESETDSFGVNAPTTSTTIALALGDALAVAVSAELHPHVAEVFAKNHPGGAIGDAHRKAKAVAEEKKVTMGDLAVSLGVMPSVGEGWGSTPKAFDVIMSAYRSPSGWVKYDDDMVIAPLRVKRLMPQEMETEATKVNGLIVPKREWIPVPAELDVKEVVAFVQSARSSKPAGTMYDDDAVMSVTHNGEPIGVVEIGTVMNR